jgi:ribonuclease HII
MMIPDVECLQKTLVDGDARCRSIAAASIVAKVVRDRVMDRCHEIYPHYGFETNKGYSTPQHIEALSRHGATPLHRFSFEPVAMTRQGDLLARVL